MAQKITNVIMLIYPVKNISFIISKVTTGTLLMALQEVRNHQRSTGSISGKCLCKICRTKTTLKPLSRCQSQTLQRYFFCIYYKLILYRIMFRALF